MHHEVCIEFENSNSMQISIFHHNCDEKKSFYEMCPSNISMG